MTFSTPAFLPFGIGLALLVAVGLWRHARRRRRLAAFLGGRRAVRRLSGSDLYRLRLERMLLLGLAALALAAAAAEPRWGEPAVEPPPPPPPRVRSVVIVIDVSASMQASDASPTRLAQAARIADELLGTLDGDRVGLLLFAGKAYPLAPPTRDHEAVRYLLRGVTPTIASAHDPGTLPSVGLQEAAARLAAEGGPDGERAIILISDGEAGEPEADVAAAARAARAEGIEIHTIGVGTARGAGMVMPRGAYQLGGPVVDAAGRPVVSRLREALLRRIAEAGGGEYAHADDAVRLRDIRAAFETVIPEPVPREGSREPAPLPARHDPTFWLTLGALLCLLIESLLDARLPRIAARPARRTA